MMTIQEINMSRMYQMNFKTPAVCAGDAELHSYIVQVIVEDVSNVICSEYAEFSVYAL